MPASEPVLLDKTVITLAAAHRHGIGASAVIRADGTAAPWLRKYGPLTSFLGEVMYLVDFDDDADDRAIQDTQRRRDDYTRLGWYPAR